MHNNSTLHAFMAGCGKWASKAWPFSDRSLTDSVDSTRACLAAQLDSVMIQENARLRDAVAGAQQQLHEVAAAAESRALAEAAQAQEGEQQTHLLVHTMSCSAHYTPLHEHTLWATVDSSYYFSACMSLTTERSTASGCLMCPGGVGVDSVVSIKDGTLWHTDHCLLCMDDPS